MQFRMWWQNFMEELYLLRKHWIPLIKESFFDTFLSWLNLFVFGLLAIFYSFAITVYRKEVYSMSDFFPPNFGWGLILAFLTMFLYQLFVNSAKKHETKIGEANKFTWRDIKIEPFEFPEGSGFGVGLQIISNKS